MRQQKKTTGPHEHSCQQVTTGRQEWIAILWNLIWRFDGAENQVGQRAKSRIKERFTEDLKYELEYHLQYRQQEVFHGGRTSLCC